MAFAVFLLAAAPVRNTPTETAQQPVNATIPADQNEEVQTNEA